MANAVDTSAEYMLTLQIGHHKITIYRLAESTY